MDSFSFVITIFGLLLVSILFLVTPIMGLQVLLLFRSSAGVLCDVAWPIAGLQVNGLALIGAYIIFLGAVWFLAKGTEVKSPFIQLYFLVTMWSGVTVFYAIDNASALRFFLQILAPLMLLFIVIRENKTWSDINTTLNFIVFSSLFPMIFGFYQFAMGLGVQKAGDVIRVNSLFHLPNPYGFYLSVIGITILVLLDINKGNRKMYAIYLCLLAMLACNFVFTGTRTALIAFTMGAGTYLLMNKRLRLLFFLAFCGLLILLSHPTTYERLMEPVNAFKTDKGIDIEKGITRSEDWRERNTLQGRIYLWTIALEHISKKPILGYGLGSHRSFLGNAVHNDYLRLLLDTGIIGLVLYMLSLFYLIINRFFAWRQSGDCNDRYLHSGVFSILFMLSVCMLADNVIVDNTLLWYVFSLIGLSLCASNLKENKSCE